jgi:hypothetical protein
LSGGFLTKGAKKQGEKAMNKCTALEGVVVTLDEELDGMCFGICFDGNCHPVLEHIQPINLSKAGNQVDLFICLDPDKHIIKPFHIDGKGQIVVKKSTDWSGDESIFFEAKVVLEQSGKFNGLASYLAQQGQEPKLFTRYPNNNIWFCTLASTGQVRVWCFSLVAQDGKFFAAIEDTQEIQAYWDGVKKQVVFPYCQWPEFQSKILEPVFADWNLEVDGILPDLNTGGENDDILRYCDDVALQIYMLLTGAARIQWYSIYKGWGVALLSDGHQARVHWESIIPSKEGDLRYLQPDDLISYKKIGAPRQTTARQTKFKYELFGVKKLS